MSRPLKKVVCLFLIATLLGVQALVSAHACAMPLATMAAADAAMMQASDMEQCEHATPLCRHHCKGEAATADHAPALPTFAFVASTTLDLSPAAAPAVAERAEDDPALIHATSPPHTVGHCCWRI